MPRLIISFRPLNNIGYNYISKHYIQSYIYEILRDTPYDVLHNNDKYKFFTYSDILPAVDFTEDRLYSFFISSPDRIFIKLLKEKMQEKEYVVFGPLTGRIEKLAVISPRIKKIKFITASPVVVSHNKRYLSFYHGTSMNLYLEKLKVNAVDKYKAYFNEEPYFTGEIFDRMVMKKSVSIPINDKGNKYNVIGIMWKILEKNVYDGKDEIRFYQFIFDTGIGIKNALGFGALNEHPTLLRSNRSSRSAPEHKPLQ